MSQTYRHVSQSPTLPGTAQPQDEFDVAALYESPLALGSAADVSLRLDEKLRKAYFWIVNHAIISPHYDLEFAEGPSRSFQLGDTKARLTLPSGQSYSSFVLVPLLTFAVRRRCLLVGGPGRGKTASAILMGVLAGYPLRDVRRAMQHGHPQLTISDMLGTPLPGTSSRPSGWRTSTSPGGRSGSPGTGRGAWTQTLSSPSSGRPSTRQPTR